MTGPSNCGIRHISVPLASIIARPLISQTSPASVVDDSPKKWHRPSEKISQETITVGDYTPVKDFELHVCRHPLAFVCCLAACRWLSRLACMNLFGERLNVTSWRL